MYWFIPVNRDFTIKRLIFILIPTFISALLLWETWKPSDAIQLWQIIYYEKKAGKTINQETDSTENRNRICWQRQVSIVILKNICTLQFLIPFCTFHLPRKIWQTSLALPANDSSKLSTLKYNKWNIYIWNVVWI